MEISQSTAPRDYSTARRWIKYGAIASVGLTLALGIYLVAFDLIGPTRDWSFADNPAYLAEFNRLRGRAIQQSLGLSASALLVAFAAVMMVRFLQGDTRRIHGFSGTTSAVEKQSASPLNEEERSTLVASLSAELRKVTSAEFLRDLRKELAENEYAASILRRAEATLERNYREIAALTRRGNLNLVLGVITALIGMAVLSYAALAEQHGGKDFQEFVLRFLPRVSVVAIIELFSYFFLRLYKASLGDIKYFQNEATNIELQFLGLLTALKQNNADLLKEAVQSFLKTERNPLLSGDQRRAEHDLEKLYATPTVLSLQHVAGLMEIAKQEGKKEKAVEK